MGCNPFCRSRSHLEAEDTETRPTGSSGNRLLVVDSSPTGANGANPAATATDFPEHPQRRESLQEDSEHCFCSQHSLRTHSQSQAQHSASSLPPDQAKRRNKKKQPSLQRHSDLERQDRLPHFQAKNGEMERACGNIRQKNQCDQTLEDNRRDHRKETKCPSKSRNKIQRKTD